MGRLRRSRPGAACGRGDSNPAGPCRSNARTGADGCQGLAVRAGERIWQGSAAFDFRRPRYAAADPLSR